MKVHEATEQAYKNGYEQGKKDAMKQCAVTREKLIKLLKSAYGTSFNAPHLREHELEPLADHLISNGVVISNLETTTKWIPVSERLPKPFTPVLVYRQSFGKLPPYIKVDKMILDVEDTQVWTDEFANWKNVTTHWMPLPEAPKGE